MTKTTIDHFILAVGERLSKRVYHALMQQKRVVVSRNKEGDALHNWVNKFEFIDDIKKDDFLKGRSVGVGTWDDFNDLRKQFFAEIKAGKVLGKMGDQPKEVFEFISMTKRMAHFIKSYNEGEDITLSTIAVLSMMYAGFMQQKVTLKRLVPCGEDGHILEYPDESLAHGTNKEQVDFESALEEYQKAKDEVWFDLPLTDEARKDAFDINAITEVSQYLSLFRIIKINPKTNEDLVNCGLKLTAKTAEKLRMYL